MEHWWVHYWYQTAGLAFVVSWAFWVLFSIVLHELAHGWAALWQGDDTPKLYQRMTWNPMVHMGPMSLLVFAVIGIAWGMMPTDPGKYRWRRKGRVVVAGAGPAMNILLAIVSVVALAVWVSYGPERQPLADNVATFFYVGALLNVVLAGFNLLPIPPLDGSSILSGLSIRWYVASQNQQFQHIGFFVLLVVFISGVGTYLFGAAASLVRHAEGALLQLM